MKKVKELKTTNEKMEFFLHAGNKFTTIQKRYKISYNDTVASYSPSGMSSYMKCPAFAFLPSTFSAAAKKGVDLHEKAADSIVALFKTGNIVPSKGDYIMDVVNMVDKLPMNSIFGVETKLVTAEKKYTNNYRFSTVLDFWSYNDTTKRLTVIDYKTGAYDVNPENNKQLMSYAFNLVKFLDLKPREIVLGIHQKDTLRTWQPTNQDMKWFVEEIQEFFNKKAGKKKYVEGAHCGSCFKKTVCPKRGKTIVKTLAKAIPTSKLSLKGLHPKKLAELLEKGKEAAKMAKLVESEVKTRFETGELDGHIKKVCVRRTPSWKSKAEALKILGEEATKTDLISVKDAKVIFGEKVNSLIIEKQAFSYVKIDDESDIKQLKGEKI